MKKLVIIIFYMFFLVHIVYATPSVIIDFENDLDYFNETEINKSQNIFGIGEEVSFIYEIISDKEEIITYVSYVDCLDIPALNYVQNEVELLPYVPYIDKYIVFPKLSGNIKSQDCKAIIDIISNEGITSFSEDFFLETDVEKSEALINNESEFYDYKFKLISILFFIILILLIYKNKNKFKQKTISDTEKQVREYIKEAKKNGQSDEEIKQELIQSGWPRDLIDKYL